MYFVYTALACEHVKKYIMQYRFWSKLMFFEDFLIKKKKKLIKIGVFDLYLPVNQQMDMTCTTVQKFVVGEI